ncbi:MAG: hypothetical protein ACKOIZ_13475 [Actinomycetota bacterium]
MAAASARQSLRTGTRRISTSKYAPDPSSGAPALDVFAVADLLRTRGWYVDRQGPPPSIHVTVNAVHAGTHEAFIADLHTAVAEIAALPAARSRGAGSYGTLE